MNEQELIKQLQKFKNLKPDEAFCRTSMQLILQTKPEMQKQASVIAIARRSMIDLFEHASLLGAAAFLIILTITALNVVSKQSPLAMTGVDLAGLVAEANSIDIHIDLPELQYIDGGPNTTISNAPKQTSPTKPKASQTFSTLTGTSTLEIDQLLEQLSK